MENYNLSMRGLTGAVQGNLLCKHQEKLPRWGVPVCGQDTFTLSARSALGNTLKHNLPSDQSALSFQWEGVLTFLLCL